MIEKTLKDVITFIRRTTLKTLLILTFILAANFVMADGPRIITVSGYGSDWGAQGSQEAAEIEAFRLASEVCQGEVKLIGELDFNIVRRNEGMITQEVTGQFECL